MINYFVLRLNDALTLKFIGLLICLNMLTGCIETPKTEISSDSITAKEILGNINYPAISYGGYRSKSRDLQPTVEELKEDMLLLSAMGVKLIRTYNVKLAHAGNVLKAIRELKQEKEDFEMYVMLGAWIDCKNAWTELPPDHHQESPENELEIERAIFLANKYPDIVKIIAVGNEAMVKWAEAYYVQSWVILKWVKHLQNLKLMNKLPAELWVTSSDNFASWGGGSEEYHNDDLIELINTVDFISMHTYPMHDTYYNPSFWGTRPYEEKLSNKQKVIKAMLRAKEYAQEQYNSVKKFCDSIGVNKPIHIGETGWASVSSGHYGNNGTKACDEYKQAMFYKHMRDWTSEAGISCFFFQAFDEPWKAAHSPNNSENHFGLFTVDGKAKYAIWDLQEQGLFEGLTRGGNPIEKTFEGNIESLFISVLLPPVNPNIE